MHLKNLLMASWLPVLLIGCFGAPDSADNVLTSLLDREWELRMESDPLFATSTGDHRFNDRLPSLLSEDLEAEADDRRGFLAELMAIDRTSLSESRRIDADMLERELRYSIRDVELHGQQLRLNADSGFHMYFARLGRTMPFENVQDYENYLSRLRETPRFFGEQIDHLRAGLERGFSQPRESMKGYETTIRLHLVESAEESEFWTPFESFSRGVPADRHETLRESGRDAILGSVVPAYQALYDFMVDDYLPNTRESFGASELPEGAEFYREQIRWHTTLELSPEEIHQIGLSEVARIRGEMEALIAEVDFDGDFADFLAFLRTDPQFYVETGDELLREASFIAKQMDGKLPALFGKLPRLPYTVEPVPDHIAPKYTSARYVNAPAGSDEPGIYWVNTYAVETRPLYSLEALTFHEAVPGHHLQIALAEELSDLPPLRRYADIGAFTEGWGLYSEWLGIEAGFYQDPFSQFGRLSYEMWRACRLVVDTGVHAMGWTRDQMIEYMASNTALPPHEVVTETDRYITWPGQALGYKMGEIEIRRLRREAEDALGGRFDVRQFHDLVLRNGPLPLPTLRAIVEEWIIASR